MDLIVVFFSFAGTAGMVAKTGVAPLDRIKILLQAQNKHYKHLGEKEEYLDIRSTSLAFDLKESGD